MGIGDVYEVGYGTTDLHYLDTGMFDLPEYGAVYLLDAERPAVVDTGIGTRWENVLSALEDLGIGPEDLEVIAPTHVHLDHAGGTGHLAEACPNAEVVVHENGARHLIDPGRLWEGTKRAVGDQIRHYAEPKPVPPERITQVSEGSVVDLGGHELRVHHAPGHAPHHAVYHDPANSVVFTADAAGIYVPALDEVYPTTPPSNFDFEQAVADTRMLARIDPDVLCYAHFGPAPTDDRLEAHVEVLTEWVESIAAAREELRDDAAVISKFVEEGDLGPVWNEDRADAVTAMDVRGVLGDLDHRAGGD